LVEILRGRWENGGIVVQMEVFYNIDVSGYGGIVPTVLDEWRRGGRLCCLPVWD
jgi:hypothetical protein